MQEDIILEGRTVSKIRIYTDGASSGNPGPSGIGVIIEFDGRTIEISRSIGKGTNNIAEYRALIAGLEKARKLSGGSRKDVEIFSDSELLVRQLNGIYKVRDLNLRKLWERVIELLRNFRSYRIIHISREENLRADELAKRAIKKEGDDFYHKDIL